jgi:uncharacterized protein YukE
MSNINVNVDQVRTLAMKLRNINQQMDDNLNEIRIQVNNLNSVWVSDGGNTLIQKFSYFQNKFIQEREIIDSYAKYLDYASNSYETIEKTIKTNASNFT